MAGQTFIGFCSESCSVAWNEQYAHIEQETRDMQAQMYESDARCGFCRGQINYRGEVAYIIVQASATLDYIWMGSYSVEVVSSPRGRDYRIVASPVERAETQLMRYRSGLAAGSLDVFSSVEEAREAINQPYM